VTFTLSPPVRYAALLGLLATVLIGAGMTMLGHGGSSAQTPHVIKHHPFGSGVKHQDAAPTAKKHVGSSPAKHPTVATKPKAAAQPAPEAKAPVPAQPPAAEQAALDAGLPAPLARALGQHGVVVVSLYNPYSEVDGIAFAEARAGAQLAGVGFVPLNVLSRTQVEKLTEQLGLLPDPGVLVYTRPAALVARLSGFADKETVAQAAQNAARTGT
jgi:hypothetical protein